MPTHIYPPMKMEQTECSETSEYKLQTPGNYPKENIQHSDYVDLVFPWFRRLLTGLLSVGLNFDSRPVHFVFVLDEMVFEEINLSAL